MNCTINVAKTKALISFGVIALISIFVFAYAKSRFSHEAAHIILNICQVKTACHNELQKLAEGLNIQT